MKKSFTDFLGREVEVNWPPKRIVSLVPSQTELLIALAGADRIVGITEFCLYPANEVSSIQKIGGTKNPSIEKIKVLKPDLIVANKEENEFNDIAAMAEFCPVWVSEICNLADSKRMIQQIAIVLDETEKANSIIEAIEKGQLKLKQLVVELSEEINSVVYLIWKNPWMAAGQDTFIHAMLNEIGMKNQIIANRYPEIELNYLKEVKPAFVFLSTEPYPFSQKHIDLLKNELPDSQIILVNGEYFSWYGNRLILAFQYLSDLVLSISKKTYQK